MICCVGFTELQVKIYLENNALNWKIPTIWLPSSDGTQYMPIFLSCAVSSAVKSNFLYKQFELAVITLQYRYLLIGITPFSDEKTQQIFAILKLNYTIKY